LVEKTCTQYHAGQAASFTHRSISEFLTRRLKKSGFKGPLSDTRNALSQILLATLRTTHSCLRGWRWWWRLSHVLTGMWSANGLSETGSRFLSHFAGHLPERIDMFWRNSTPLPSRARIECLAFSYDSRKQILRPSGMLMTNIRMLAADSFKPGDDFKEDRHFSEEEAYSPLLISILTLSFSNAATILAQSSTVLNHERRREVLLTVLCQCYPGSSHDNHMNTKALIMQALGSVLPPLARSLWTFAVVRYTENLIKEG